MSPGETSQEPSGAAIEQGLQRLGYERFRPGQREAIETLLERRRLLLVAPTGGGKSLSYQLPAIFLPGTTVVVSPLIALMADQVQALTDRGVPATFLASTLDGDTLRSRMAAMAEGQFKLVYVAPERLSYGGFQTLLRRLNCPLVAIDEAHCISEWGHDFRPDYMQLGGLLEALPEARVLACTATATPVVRDEILARLGLPADTPQLLRGFARPNLVLRAREVDTAKERRQHIDQLLAEAIGPPPNAKGAGIIYAPTRRKAEAEGERLAKAGYRAAVYHAGLTPQVRQRVQEGFSRGKLDVVVATNAFGMGIDRADVRAVGHLGPPSSIEAYYQEVGRGGRDGEPAIGLLLCGHQDMAMRRRLLEQPVDGRAPDPAVVDHKWQLFLELMRWVEGGSCRHDAILRYFSDEAETLAGCGRCDICARLAAGGSVAGEAEGEEVTLLVRKALSGVARVRGRYGLTAAAKLLVGKADERMRRGGLHETTTYGVLGDRDLDYIVRLLRRCVTAGWVTFQGEDRPMVTLTREGAQVMRGERPVRLLLPERGRGAPAGGQIARRERSVPSGPALDAASEAVFEALRAQRFEWSKEQGVPPYVIASDRSLRDLAILRPRTKSDLLMVHGIGPTKLERYGAAWLELVAGADSRTDEREPNLTP